MGRFGSESPARLRRMAPATTPTASSWPMTRPFRTSSKSTSFSISPCIILATGMPVQAATTDAISSSETSSFRIAPSCCFIVHGFLGHVQLLLQLGNARVADLGSELQVALAGGALLIKLSAFQLGLEVLHVDDGVLLVLPLSLLANRGIPGRPRCRGAASPGVPGRPCRSPS